MPLTFEEANAIFQYHPDKGYFTWKDRGQKDRRYIGHQVYELVKDGYKHIKYDQKWIVSHRLAWLLFYGEYPKLTVDHINFDKLDNRIGNLRDIPRALNAQHRKQNANTGIYCQDHEYGTRWVATVKIDGKWTIRTFLTREEAVTARCEHRARYLMELNDLQTIDRYRFPPMLGPASKQEVGSFAWGECYGNELDYTAEHARDAIDDLAALVKRMVSHNPAPWYAFAPCDGSADRFFQMCCGMTSEQVVTLLEAFGFSSVAYLVKNA